ncbi:leucine rich adaptor protein 1-like [Brienomyrus brachyistius]|uniref:leucine rich adaptor protein 1-like n=1 Tax=Brienomyrus brachyistius TaxID=42636 RepID=UPI0020B1E21A|nr:leucine rich adaptor protein 1-like [Brienomyrus brachyistius]
MQQKPNYCRKSFTYESEGREPRALDIISFYHFATNRDMDGNPVLDFKDIETKVGRKIPEGLKRSIWQGGSKQAKEEMIAAPCVPGDNASASRRLHGKVLLLRQEMAHLRAIDIKLMQQLLAINDAIESIKWVMEDKGPSRDSSLAGSLNSLLDSPENSLRGSCDSLQGMSDGSDGVSVGSYLDTLDVDNFSQQLVLEDALDNDAKAELNTYYCFR